MFLLLSHSGMRASVAKAPEIRLIPPTFPAPHAIPPDHFPLESAAGPHRTGPNRRCRKSGIQPTPRMKRSNRRERAAAHRAKREPVETTESPEQHPRRQRRAGSGHAALARNLVIIAGLILAVAFTWKKYRSTLATREAEHPLMAQHDAAPASATAPVTAPHQDPPTPPAEAPDFESPPLFEPEPEPEPEPPPPAEPPAAPEILSPAQSLIRLRADLAAGKRDAMPVGTVSRGTSDFFLVATPMTWSQANGFADAYGGHLPLAGQADDLAWLASQLAEAAATDPARSSLWLGARKHGEQWFGIDGSPLDALAAGEGTFAAVAADGSVRARGDADRHPFFIQWQRDGSNPASLGAVLARTKASLDSPAPAYPPGTLSDGERHFLIVSRAVNATAARDLAALGGGHLMVPATPAEADWIDARVTAADFPKGLWLGGALSDSEWRWDSGEAWTFARWDPAAEPGQGSALRMVPGAGWQPADPAAEASGFVIEWSRDAAGPTGPPQREGPADLLGKAAILVAAADQQRQAELTENARAFAFNLDAWLRTNNKGEITRWKPRIEALKARVRGNRVPGNLPEKPDGDFSDRMLKVARGCLEKEQSIDAAYLAKAARIRDAHVARLLELAALEKQRGQPDLARQLAATAEAAADLDAWLATLGPLPAP